MYATAPDSTNILLINFIPRVLLDEDMNNQLRQFLTAINETLNDIHTYIRTLPDQFDIDSCDDVFINEMAQIVGFGFDYFAPTEIQKKKKIKVLLRLLKKKGTDYCVQLALQDLDSTGDVVHLATKLMVPSQQGLLSTLNCYLQDNYHYHEGSIEVVTDTYVDPDELWDLLEDIWPLGFVCWLRQKGTWPGTHVSFTDRLFNMNSISIVTMNDQGSVLTDGLKVNMYESSGRTTDLRSNLDPRFEAS